MKTDLNTLKEAVSQAWRAKNEAWNAPAVKAAWRADHEFHESVKALRDALDPSTAELQVGGLRFKFTSPTAYEFSESSA
jgi:hypothetical protein